jgi:hypothetical protein
MCSIAVEAKPTLGMALLFFFGCDAGQRPINELVIGGSSASLKTKKQWAAHSSLVETQAAFTSAPASSCFSLLELLHHY